MKADTYYLSFKDTLAVQFSFPFHYRKAFVFLRLEIYSLHPLTGAHPVEEELIMNEKPFIQAIRWVLQCRYFISLILDHFRAA